MACVIAAAAAMPSGLLPGGTRAIAAGLPVQGRLPPAAVAAGGELRRLGSGTMRWFGLHIYDAVLWVRGSQWDADDTFALDIVYAREITGKALAESSIGEMKRVGFNDEAQHVRWLAAMTRVLPNVARGDRLVALHQKGTGTLFFNQDRSLGSIEDPVFGQAFFAIWLDPKTRETQLRARLLGRG